MKECDDAFIRAKETLASNPILYHLDPNLPWHMPVSYDNITQKKIHTIPITFISYNFTRPQACRAMKREFYAIFITIQKLQCCTSGGQLIIRTDQKPLIEICSGTTKKKNTAVEDKLHHWKANLLAYKPEIEYKKGSINLIADSLSRFRSNDYYMHEEPLNNTEPIDLDSKGE